MRSKQYFTSIKNNPHEISTDPVLPGQVHSFVQATGLNAYILMIDSAFIEENSKRSFEQYTLGTQTVELSPEQQTELTSLFTDQRKNLRDSYITHKF